MPLLSFFKHLVNDRNAETKEAGDNDCSACAIPFSLLVRKHTCALCRRPFCSKCTRTVLLVSSRLGEPTPARVCDTCYAERKKQAPETFGSDKAAGLNSALKAATYQQLVDYTSVENGEDDNLPASKVARVPTTALGQGRLESPKQVPVKKNVISSVGTGKRDKELKDGVVCWDVPPELEVGSEDAKVNLLPEVRSTYEVALSSVATSHLSAIALQLLEAGGVAEASRWTPIVSKLASDAAALVSPSAMAANGNTDPRFYIKVKRVPGGSSPEDSCLVDGLVIRKNVVHRNMRTNILQPRIILLQGELELSSNQVSSLDKVMEQGPARLQQAVARIAEFAPNVLVLEKTVPHSAKEFLLANDIAVVQSVKLRTLERLSRCTDTPIVQAVQAINNQSVGHCKEFVIERIAAMQSEGSSTNLMSLASSGASVGEITTTKRLTADPPGESMALRKTQGAKTLMYFKGCKKPLGCTILLKGASQDELTRVKQVTRFLAYAAHRTRLETSFLADCIVSATAALSVCRPSALNTPATPSTQRGLDVVTEPALSSPKLLKQVADDVAKPNDFNFDSLSNRVWIADQSQAVASNSANNTSAARSGGAILSVSPHVTVSVPVASHVIAKHGTQPSAEDGAVDEPADPSVLIGFQDRAVSSSPPSSQAILLSDVEISVVPSSDSAHLLSPRQYAQARTPVASFTSLTPSVSRPSTPQTSTLRPSTPLLPVQSAQFDHPLQPPPSPDDPLSLAVKELELEALKSPKAKVEPSLDLRIPPEGSPEQPQQGTELYESQVIYVSTTCKSDIANIWCEEPSLQSIDFCSVKDLSLAAFLASAIPHPPKKCGVPACGEGPHHHRRTFLHDRGRITLVVHQLTEGHEVPGADRGQVWMWMRPIRSTPDSSEAARRVPLTPDVACMSFGHFLDLCFGAKNMVVQKTQLQTGFVRYFAMGTTLACFQYEQILPNTVHLPSVVIHFSPRCEHDWLVEEVEEVGKAARDIYGTLEYALQQQAANLHTQDPADVQSWYNCHSLAVVVCQELDQYLDALRLVNTALQQLDDVALIEGSPKRYGGQRTASPVELNAICNIVLEINRLRRQLAIASLTWVATVHDPVVYSRTQTLSSTLRDTQQQQTVQPAKPAAPEATPAAIAAQMAPAASLTIVTAEPSLKLADQSQAEPSQEPVADLPACLHRLNGTEPVANGHEVDTASLQPTASDHSLANGQALTPLADANGTALVVFQEPSRGGMDRPTSGDNQSGGEPSLAQHQLESVSSMGSMNSENPGNKTAFGPESSTCDASKSSISKSGDTQSGRQHMLAWLVSSQFDSISPSSCSPGMESPLMAHPGIVENSSYLSLNSAASTIAPAELVAVKLIVYEDGSVKCVLQTGNRHLRLSSTDSAGFTEIMNRPSTAPRACVAVHSQLTEALKDASDRGLVSPRFGSAPVPPEDREMPEILGILSPRWGENLLAEGRKLSGPLLHPQFGLGSYLKSNLAMARREDALETVPEGSRTMDIPIPAMTQTSAELGGRRSDDVARVASASSSVYAGHFDDWAKFVNHNVQQQADGLPDEAAPATMSDAAALIDAVHVRAIQDQQWADLEQIGKIKLQSGRKGELLPGVIPLLTQQNGKQPDKPSELILNGRSLLPLGMDDKSFTVFDDEPTSAVAYALNTRHYQTFVHDAMATVLYGSTGAGPAVSKEWSETHDTGGRPELGPSRLSYTATELDSTVSVSGVSDISAADFGEHTAKYWKTLLSCEQFHFRHQFEDTSPGMPWGRAKFQVIAYYAPQFQALRYLFASGSDKMFTASVCRCRKWDSKGGKSNAYFAKTRDNRWIVKQLSKSEKQSFLEFAPNYFRFLANAVKKNRETCLAKIVGVFQVSVKPSGPSTAVNVGSLYGKDGVIDFLVMENVFYGHRIHKIYDLKGSERSRYNPEDQSDPTCVLLDENLKEANLSAPILVQQEAWVGLERALYNDTNFLANLDVMDYSLLVGVDRENQRLVVGIIDFIRQYTWDKQLETWVKSSGILGGAGKEPTVISPIQYAKRFRTAMSSYFTLVPSWRPLPALNNKDEAFQGSRQDSTK